MARRLDVVRTTTRITFPVVLIFALEQVFHAGIAPGEGFSGGLLVALSILLLYVGMGAREVEPLLPRLSRWGAPLGLGVCLLTGLFGLLFRGNFLEGIAFDIQLLGRPLHLGTAFLFDFGIFLVVSGGALSIFRAVGRAEEELG